MINNRYLFESSPDLLTFEFNSIGPKGIITKVIRSCNIEFRSTIVLSKDKTSIC